MQQLDRRAIWVFFIQSFSATIATIVLFGFIVFGVAIGEASRDSQLAISFLLGCTAILILICIISYIWAYISYQHYSYELTAEAIRIEHGIIWKQSTFIPYERIQNVDIHRGMLERIFRIANLQIQTVSYSHGNSYTPWSEGHLPGLNSATARQLRQELVLLAKGTDSSIIPD